MNLLLAVEGTVLCVLGLSFVLKLVPQNRWLGVITNQTRTVRSTWYRANREFGLIILAIGVLAWIASAFPSIRVGSTIFVASFLFAAIAFYVVIRRYAA